MSVEMIKKCKNCGNEFLAKSHGGKYCETCRNIPGVLKSKHKISVNKKCKVCGESYAGVGLFCSDKCKEWQHIHNNVCKKNCPKCKFSFKLSNSEYICCHGLITGEYKERLKEGIIYPCKQFVKRG